MSKKLKGADLVVVRIDEDSRPLCGYIRELRNGTLVVVISERDPIWHGARFRVSDAYSLKKCELEQDKQNAELAVRWGLSLLYDAKRCPTCGTNNTIRQLDTSRCMSCVVSTEVPRRLPKRRAKDIKIKTPKKRGRPPKKAA